MGRFTRTESVRRTAGFDRRGGGFAALTLLEHLCFYLITF